MMNSEIAALSERIRRLQSAGVTHAEIGRRVAKKKGVPPGRRPEAAVSAFLSRGQWSALIATYNEVADEIEKERGIGEVPSPEPNPPVDAYALAVASIDRCDEGQLHTLRDYIDFRLQKFAQRR